MRSFQRPGTFDPVPGDLVALLRRIDMAAGSEARHADQVPQLLEALRQQARIESITASSAIEGVEVDEARAPKLASGEVTSHRNRSEAEFAGYTAALDYLNQADPGDLSVGLVLHLHRLLYSFTDARGGYFKLEDNLVVDRLPDGARSVVFEPVSASESPLYVEELVARVNGELRGGSQHPLILIAAFVLDFLCIHPFSDGNGRVGRLLTGYLLDRSGYGVGRYLSIEQLVYETKQDYYASLRASTAGWFDDANHDLWPWARYLLARVDDAYEKYEARVAAGTAGTTKQERVRNHILLSSPENFTIADIRRALPGVSDNTIRLVLTDMRRDGLIANDGTGRSTSWHRIPMTRHV